MSIYTIIAVVLVLGSVALFAFESLSGIMSENCGQEEFVSETINLVSIFGREHFSWIYGISWSGGQKALHWVVTTHLYVLLFCISILFLIVSGLRKN